MIPLLDLRAQLGAIEGELWPALRRVIESGRFVLGAEGEAFERELAAFCGAPHAVGVANGTDAIALALRALGVGPGDEVVTTPLTFFATAEAIVEVGARPVFADVRPESGAIDPAAAAAAIGPRTRALLPVHLWGNPAPADALAATARAHGLRLVEDCAQAHGAKLAGVPVGTFGDAATFSFYPGKNLGAYGDGGAVITADAGVAAHVRAARDHGQPAKHDHRFVGRNSRLDEVQAAVLRVKLRQLAGWNRARRDRAAALGAHLAAVPDVTPMAETPGAEAVYHQFVIRAPRRDDLARHLRERGVATGVHYPRPLHLLPALAELGLREGAFPHAEALCADVLSLPCYPELTEEQLERIADGVRTFYGG